MSVHFTDKDHGWDALKREIAKTKQGPHVAVGVLGEKAAADHGGVPNVTVAIAHEFGVQIQHPGGTAYIGTPDGARFVSNATAAAMKTPPPRTKPHKIDIPERSFIRGTFDAKAKQIAAKAKELADAVLRGHVKGPGGTTAPIDMHKALETIGLFVKGLIQGRISAGIPPPLKASTIARKGSSKPLINTGQLRASIDFEVREVK